MDKTFKEEYRKSIEDDTNGRIEFLEVYYIIFTFIIFILLYYLNII